MQRPVAVYLGKLAEAVGAAQSSPKRKPPKYISETDPDAVWSLKDGPGRFSYETNNLVDTDRRIIEDVEATPARLSQEIVAAKTKLDRSATRHDFQPDRPAASGPMAPALFWPGFASVRLRRTCQCWIGSIKPKANMTSAISSTIQSATATPALRVIRCLCDVSGKMTGSRVASPAKKPAGPARLRRHALTRRSEPSHAA